MPLLDLDDKKKLLRNMLLSRAGDLREQSLIRQGKGWFHVSGMGHEALSVAGYLMRDGDMFAGYYRDRSIAIARGVSNYELALSFFAKKASASGGRQMPAHFSSRELGILSISSVVSSSLLPAAGMAWAMQLDGKDNVVITSTGDAASRQGDFFESVAFALERQLPIIYLVEDNGIGISTVTENINPLGLEILNSSQWKIIDGCDADNVFEAIHPAMAAARAGKGPQFIWCRTERISSHSSADDHRKYRSEEELAGLDDKDPITRLKNDLINSGDLTEEGFEELKQAIEAEVRMDYERAFEEMDPATEDLLTNVLGASTQTPALELPLDSEEPRMVDSINAVFHNAVERSTDYVFFGQDIEDPKGGVFSLTKGLSTKAPAQVFNSPLAEATIIGTAVGMGAYGKRPVFEIQFVDFIWPGFNQLISQLSTLHWRTNGEWSAPAVIYAPYGAYLPGGAIWHSQANEGALAHFPGLQIAIPSLPDDAAGLLWTALHGNSPTLVLIPKHLMWTPMKMDRPFRPIPFGRASIRNEGSDLTVVTWGNCRELVESTLEQLESPELVEVIDLRTVVPLDMAAVEKSVRKTGRLLVVQEDAESCSVGQNIISRISSNRELFSLLKAPPTLLAKPDVNIGYNPALEYAALPGKEDVIAKIQELLQIQLTKESSSRVTALPSSPVVNKMMEILDEDMGESARNQIEVTVPILGEGITSARVIALISKPGDEVECDDPLCEVETDKALFPIESAYDGKLLSWKVEEGDEVEVGQVIAVLEIEESAPLAASPASRHKVDVERESLTIRPSEGGLGATIVAQLKNVVPAHLAVKAGWKNIRDSRKAAKESMGAAAPSPTTMVAWALVQAMKRHPVFSCTVSPDDSLQQNEVFDFGVAVALKADALDTAIIPRASELDGPGFLKAYNEAIREARDGHKRSKASVPLILTSMGGFSVRDAQPLVVPPAVGTLFLGEAHWETRGPDKMVEEVKLCLSFDHRWLNGAACAHFLQDVKQEMEAFKLDMLIS